MTEKGQGATVKISGTAVGEIQDYNCALIAEAIEDGNITDTWKTFQQGQRGFSGSLKAWFDEDDASQIAIRNAVLTGAADGVVSALRLDYSHGVTSNGYVQGDVVITNIALTNPGVAGIIEMSADFQGTGTPTWTGEVSP